MSTDPADPAASPGEERWDYAAYCAFIRNEGLIPSSREHWLAFNRALDATSAAPVNLPRPHRARPTFPDDNATCQTSGADVIAESRTVPAKHERPS
jgi:hypothetical protein